MSLSNIKILGISVTSSPKEEILEYLKKYLHSSSGTAGERTGKRRKPVIVVTPNPEQIVLAQADARFREILNRADVALPDGTGVVVAARLLGLSDNRQVHAETLTRMPGVEFMESLVAVAEKEGVRIGLIGGFDGLAVRTLECLRRKYPKLKGWGADAPVFPHGGTSSGTRQFVIPTGFAAEITEKISLTDTGIVFVGLGAPKQEILIDELRIYRERVTGRKTDVPLVLMSVGGSFDILSGSIQRAPVYIRNVGMEWMWRLFHEPWRWRRQLSLVRFMLLTVRQMFRRT